MQKDSAIVVKPVDRNSSGLFYVEGVASANMNPKAYHHMMRRMILRSFVTTCKKIGPEEYKRLWERYESILINGDYVVEKNIVDTNPKRWLHVSKGGCLRIPREKIEPRNASVLNEEEEDGHDVSTKSSNPQEPKRICFMFHRIETYMDGMEVVPPKFHGRKDLTRYMRITFCGFMDPDLIARKNLIHPNSALIEDQTMVLIPKIHMDYNPYHALGYRIDQIQQRATIPLTSIHDDIDWMPDQSFSTAGDEYDHNGLGIEDHVHDDFNDDSSNGTEHSDDDSLQQKPSNNRDIGNNKSHTGSSETENRKKGHVKNMTDIPGLILPPTPTLLKHESQRKDLSEFWDNHVDMRKILKQLERWMVCIVSTARSRKAILSRPLEKLNAYQKTEPFIDQLSQTLLCSAVCSDNLLATVYMNTMGDLVQCQLTGIVGVDRQMMIMHKYACPMEMIDRASSSNRLWYGVVRKCVVTTIRKTLLEYRKILYNNDIQTGLKNAETGEWGVFGSTVMSVRTYLLEQCKSLPSKSNRKRRLIESEQKSVRPDQCLSQPEIAGNDDGGNSGEKKRTKRN